MGRQLKKKEREKKKGVALLSFIWPIKSKHVQRDYTTCFKEAVLVRHEKLESH